MFLRILYILLAIPITFIILHTIIRIIRYFYKFPMPQWMANVIDNPLRRRIQPPDETAIRHGIEPGMRVLEIGPGNGTYTLATARRLGPEGELVTVDIEPKMIERVQHRTKAEGITNIDARVADAYDLPFENESFDLVYMITVINEIPNIPQALAELHRVLKSSGTLVFSELFMDPDYPRAATLTRKVETLNFSLKEKIGKFFYYTLIFEKSK
ncbi:MAG: methyltransferase domain-containing protein [Anaerolineales bacterium]|nr:methyltransferase domain-containing protein [Chloroflexota bacterium]MBL6982679.1 methyltransferase domain-containing protein [Anaerolineales bacterium]